MQKKDNLKFIKFIKSSGKKEAQIHLYFIQKEENSTKIFSKF